MAFISFVSVSLLTDATANLELLRPTFLGEFRINYLLFDHYNISYCHILFFVEVEVVDDGRGGIFL